MLSWISATEPAVHRQRFCWSHRWDRQQRRPQARLLVDRGGADRTHCLILRAGTAGATDGADDLAVFDQRDTPAGGDDVVERQNKFVVRLLNSILKDPGRS